MELIIHRIKIRWQKLLCKYGYHIWFIDWFNRLPDKKICGACFIKVAKNNQTGC